MHTFSFHISTVASLESNLETKKKRCFEASPGQEKMHRRKDNRTALTRRGLKGGWKAETKCQHQGEKGWEGAGRNAEAGQSKSIEKERGKESALSGLLIQVHVITKQNRKEELLHRSELKMLLN